MGSDRIDRFPNGFEQRATPGAALSGTPNILQSTLSRIRGGGVGALMVRAGSASFVTNIAGAGLGFVSQVVLARIMGKEGFGPYIFVVSFLSVLVIFAQLGYDRLLLRFLSVYRTQSEWALFRGIARSSAVVGLVCGGAIGVVMAAAVWAFQTQIDDDLAATFRIAAIVLPLFTVAYIYQNGLQALKHPVLGQVPILVLRPAIIIVGAVALAIFVDAPITSPDAMTVNLVATAGVMVFAMYYFRMRTPTEGRDGEVVYQWRMWTLTALPFMAQAGFHMLARRTDVMMLGFFSNVVDAGVYAAAARLADLGGFGAIAMNAITAPLIAEAFAKEDNSRLQRIVSVTAALSLSIALPVTIIFCVGGGLLLQVFGEGFDEARVALAILAIGMLGNVLTGPVGVTLMMTGRQNVAAGAATLSASVNVALNFLLIPRYGIEGAAVATSISYVLTNFLMLVIVLRSMRINPTILGLMRRAVR